MIGSVVNHPLFGRGVVQELRNAAREAVVRFDSGIRAVVQVSMLSVLKEVAASAAAVAVSQPAPAPRAEAPPPPEKLRQLEARQTIEALRYGVVPSKRIRELSAGLAEERESLHRAFDEVARSGGDVRIVLGEYGTGKSHFFELAAQEALERNFLVAATSLDVREVPPNRPQRIYNALIRALRYPDATDVGTLAPLLDRIVDQPTLYASLIEKAQGTVFSSVLYNYSLLRKAGGEPLDLLLDWISGEKVFIKSVRDALPVKSKEFPVRALSMMTTAADQYCYLLNGWGWMAREVGYAGLAVLLDESEHYSLLNARGQERADNFFKGMIYTALASRPDCQVSESELQHQQREHPFRFAERSELLLMFAVTPSANTFDYRRWLYEDQIIALKGRPSAAELDELMARLYVLHRQAYSYERADQYLDVAQGLLECLENGLINLRQTIRLATEIYDLCYAHADFAATQAVAEMRRALIGR
jgi:hypothetical protein